MRESAGLVVFRRRGDRLEVLLVHPGGPFWSKRDTGAWSIPKGEIETGEEPVEVARREFHEELGLPAPDGDLKSVGMVRQASGKLVHAWAVESEVDVSRVRSMTVPQGWPEVDRAEWFDLETAREKINPAQAAFLDRLAHE